MIIAMSNQNSFLQPFVPRLSRFEAIKRCLRWESGAHSSPTSLPCGAMVGCREWGCLKSYALPGRVGMGLSLLGG